MNVETKSIELGTKPLPGHLHLKAPPTDEQKKWIAAELQNYVIAIRYLSFFFEMRSRLGDMTEEEVWDEITKNVSMVARGGYDVLGEQ